MPEEKEESDQPETSKKEKLTQILQKLTSTGDIEGAAVITRDGLVIASELSEGIDADTFAAMSATMTGAAETAVQELKKSSPDRVIVESPKTKLITTGAGEKAILVILAEPKLNLGLALLELGRASGKISDALG